MRERSRSCQHLNLVTTRVARVEQCSHGTLHLMLGDMTLRLAPDDFLDLAQALSVAAARVERPRLVS